MDRNENAIDRARRLRSNSTDAEQTLWYYLRKRQIAGHKFRRQCPIGGYIVDFVCLHKRLVVEVDGGQHQENLDYDQRRSRCLQQLGFKVLRFWNNEVLTTPQTVTEVIYNELTAKE